jgi:hypothetical protein
MTLKPINQEYQLFLLNDKIYQAIIPSSFVFFQVF